METVTPPAGIATGVEIARKYRLGALLATDSRQTDFETIFRGAAARIRIFKAPPAGQSLSLAGFQLAFQLAHPHLLTLYDFGEDIIAGERIAWIVMERGDECLADILRTRHLEEEEVRVLMEGILPALDFLQERKLGHSEIRAANVIACGQQIKLTPDRITSAAAESGADQISRLILEALTGSPDEAGAEQLATPFKEIVQEGSTWDLATLKAALSGELFLEPVAPVTYAETVEGKPQPKYRKYAGLAAGGVLAAAALCALLIRGANQPSPTATATAVPEKVPAIAPVPVNQPAPLPAANREPARSSPQPLPPKGWDILTGPFASQADAEKRAQQFGKAHPGLEPKVYSADKFSQHFVIVFASAPTLAQAKKQLIRLHRGGTPRGTHIAHFE
jgi:hypothetical protein